MCGAQFEGAGSNNPSESLVSNEGWVSRGTLEPLVRLRGPRKKIALVDERPWRPSMNHMRGVGIVFDANAVAVVNEKPSVPTGWIEETVFVAADDPFDESRNYITGRIVRP